MIQRDGKYLPYALVIDICQRNSTIPNARLTPQDWDQIFEEWGTFQCQPTVPAPSQPAAAPPQQPQIRYCPPPEESSQQYGYVETTFEAAFYKKIFFGEQPAVVRVYFSPDTPENRDIARDMLRRQKILTYLTDELKEDVNVGVIAPADMAARAAFDTVDDIDTWVEVRKNPTLCGILGAVAGTFIIGYGVHKVRQSRKVADGPGPRPVPKPLAQARGGTYVLRDPVTGRVMRTGRTNDLARRQLEHARDPALRDYVFEPVHRTDVYAEQRGLEQLLHETHNPPLNRIRGISPTNPRLPEYRDAAQRFLERQQGGQ